MSRTLAIVEPSHDLTRAAELLLDARVDPRVGVDFTARIFSADFSGPLAVAVRDLSVGGACIASASGFSFKALQRIEIDLPNGPIEFETQGRWQNRSSIDTAVLTGTAFAALSKSDVSRLWDAVHTAGREISRFISASSDLDGLSTDGANSLAECSRYTLIRARQAIYQRDRRGHADDSIFLVIRGEVRLTCQIGRRRDVILERLKPGSIFGGLPIVASLNNFDSAIADADSVLLEVSHGSFAYLRIARPLLAQQLTQLVTRKQIERSLRMTELAERCANE